MSVTSVSSLRSSLAQRRAARAERQRLARELSEYRTPAERLELDLILGRHSEEATADIHEILSRQTPFIAHRRSA